MGCGTLYVVILMLQGMMQDVNCGTSWDCRTVLWDASLLWMSHCILMC